MPEATTPSLGITIPYYGSEVLLRRAVTSITRQSDSAWSLVVVIDGQDQPPVEVWLDSLDDPRISHHRNPTTLGVAGNFQRCLELTAESRVTFMGCDDELGLDYVKRIRSVLAEQPDAGVILPEVDIIDHAGREHAPLVDRVKRRLRPQGGVDRPLHGQRLMASLMVGNWTYFPAACWDRERVLTVGFRPDLPITLDLALLAELVLSGAAIALCPHRVFRYRRHDGSASSLAAVASTRFEEERRIHREIARSCRDRGWIYAAVMARIRPTSRLHALAQVFRALRHGDLSKVRPLISAAVL